MKTIRIVKNTDRCHCSIDNVPIVTFLYSNYKDRTNNSKEEHAISDAKVECFNSLLRLNREGIKAVINPYILIL